MSFKDFLKEQQLNEGARFNSHSFVFTDLDQDIDIGAVIRNPQDYIGADQTEVQLFIDELKEWEAQNYQTIKAFSDAPNEIIPNM